MSRLPFKSARAALRWYRQRSQCFLAVHIHSAVEVTALQQAFSSIHPSMSIHPSIHVYPSIHLSIHRLFIVHLWMALFFFFAVCSVTDSSFLPIFPPSFLSMPSMPVVPLCCLLVPFANAQTTTTNARNTARAVTTCAKQLPMHAHGGCRLDMWT